MLKGKVIAFGVLEKQKNIKIYTSTLRTLEKEQIKPK